jgi:hypothetical protein
MCEARAALSAVLANMREPSEGMTHDSNATDPNTEMGHELPFLDAKTTAYIWQAMLSQYRDENLGNNKGDTES